VTETVTQTQTSTQTSTQASTSDAADAARRGYQAWRSGRLASVTAPLGNLSLIETRWYADGDEPTLAQVSTGLPHTVTVTRLERRNIDTGEPEHGFRLWDANSDAIQRFETISAFDFDPSWVIDADFSPVASDRTIPFEHIRDNGGTRELVVPGDIRFARDGVEYTFIAFDDGGVLLLVFGDSTNGQDGEDGTYASGRFLFVQRADDGGFGDAGRVVLDFNRAFVPPCGFSAHYNCPLPPRNNRFDLPVTAGEKRVVFRDDIH
jgi:uncharacterized protein (DUF1684 family)